MITQKHIQKISYDIMACAIEVHKYLGPGLLESIYQSCLVQELRLNNFFVKEQVEVPVIYKGVVTKDPLRLDILVNDLIIIEVKSVEILLPIHHAQAITYLKLCQKPKVLLINFNSVNLVQGSKPFVDEVFASLPKE
jgi:GxxExxY protein